MLSKILLSVAIITASSQSQSMEEVKIDLSQGSSSIKTREKMFHDLAQNFGKIAWERCIKPVISKQFESLDYIEENLRQKIQKEIENAASLVTQAMVQKRVPLYREAFACMKDEEIKEYYEMSVNPLFQEFISSTINNLYLQGPLFLRKGIAHYKDTNIVLPESLIFNAIKKSSYLLKEMLEGGEDQILEQAHKAVIKSDEMKRIITFIHAPNDESFSVTLEKLKASMAYIPEKEIEEIVAQSIIQLSDIDNKEILGLYIAKSFGHFLWDGKLADKAWGKIQRDLLHPTPIIYIGNGLAPFSSDQKTNILLNAALHSYNDLRQKYADQWLLFEAFENRYEALHASITKLKEEKYPESDAKKEKEKIMENLMENLNKLIPAGNLVWGEDLDSEEDK